MLEKLPEALDRLRALPKVVREEAMLTRGTAQAVSEAYGRISKPANMPGGDQKEQNTAVQKTVTVEKKREALVEQVAPVAVQRQVHGDRRAQLDALRPLVLACEKCSHLVKQRTQVVFGVGNPEAELMFVGEAPGADEDVEGEPFVGRAGQLLTKIIEAMGLSRDKVFIANVLKCRPDMPPGTSGNRKPLPDEMATCLPWLRQQIGIVQPKAIVALGATAVEGLFGETSTQVGASRGRWRSLLMSEVGGAGEPWRIPVMPTYHPAYLLRRQTLSEKRKVWEDLLQVMEHLEMPISAKQRAFFTKS